MKYDPSLFDMDDMTSFLPTPIIKKEKIKKEKKETKKPLIDMALAMSLMDDDDFGFPVEIKKEYVPETIKEEDVKTDKSEKQVEIIKGVEIKQEKQKKEKNKKSFEINMADVMGLMDDDFGFPLPKIETKQEQILEKKEPLKVKKTKEIKQIKMEDVMNLMDDDFGFPVEIKKRKYT